MSNKQSCDIVIFSAKARLPAFYAGNKLLPGLAEAPHVSILHTIDVWTRGAVIIVCDHPCALPSRFRRKYAIVDTRIPRHRGPARTATAIVRRLRSAKVLLIDAGAPFIEKRTLAALMAKLTRFDLAGITGSSAAVALTRRQLAAVARAGGWRGSFWQLFCRQRDQGMATGLVPEGLEHERVLRTPMAHYEASRAIRLVRAGQLMSQGLGLRDPGSFDLQGVLSFGRGVSIGANVALIGEVSLGAGVTVGSNCVLENCVIRAGTCIREFSLVGNAVIGENCRIGPYARVRPGTSLGSECHIGNFVEIKSTTMGKHCKINHHSFIGDARLGHGVIIGAGSITCNYDRGRTNSTIIRDGAFIGSGVMLIAPITVGERAFIGAGSTIVRRAPANSLTLSRPKQITIKGWPGRKARLAE
jgi:acetyltransferase-like isoleucine patch superfamily enzyme